MVAFTLHIIFIIQVLLLIVGPLSVFGALAWVVILAKKTSRELPL